MNRVFFVAALLATTACAPEPDDAPALAPEDVESHLRTLGYEGEITCHYVSSTSEVCCEEDGVYAGCYQV